MAELKEGFICAMVAQRDSPSRVGSRTPSSHPGDAADYHTPESSPQAAPPLTVPNRLRYRRGDTLHVTSMADCPVGYWQCRSAAGQLGYALSAGRHRARGAHAADLAIDPTLLKVRLKQLTGTNLPAALTRRLGRRRFERRFEQQPTARHAQRPALAAGRHLMAPC